MFRNAKNCIFTVFAKDHLSFPIYFAEFIFKTFKTHYRNLWHHYFENTDAVIFVVDSTDRERFDEAAEELHDLMKDDRLRNAALLVLANKQDMPNAANPAEITDKFRLMDLRSHEWYVQACSAINGEGLVDGLSWLAPKVKANKKKF